MTKPPPKKKPKSDAQIIADALWYLEAMGYPPWLKGDREYQKLARTMADLRALLSRMMADGGGKGRGEEAETP